MVASEAAGEKNPEAYPLGYVEDFGEARTKLEEHFQQTSTIFPKNLRDNICSCAARAS